MSRFSNDCADIEADLADEFNDTVMYHAEGVTIAWSARVELQSRRVIDEGGAPEIVTSRDYCGPAAELVSGGVAIVPAAGHQIQETVGGVARIFEIMRLPDAPCWEWADPQHREIRVHTKEV